MSELYRGEMFLYFTIIQIYSTSRMNFDFDSFGVLLVNENGWSYLGEWAAAREMFHNFDCGGASGKASCTKKK